MIGWAVCTVCGNELDAILTRCPYCGEKREAKYRELQRETFRVVNLERGKPSVDSAINRLDRELERGCADDVKLLVFIHGYGSSGAGGAIKERVREKLQNLLARKKIAEQLKGEECYKSSSRVKKILKRFPGAKEYLQGRNQGITLVLLK